MSTALNPSDYISLADFVSLFKNVKRGNFSNELSIGGFGDKNLHKHHRRYKNLLLEHYIETAIVDDQTALLLDSVGVPEDQYDAELSAKGKFSHFLTSDLNNDILQTVAYQIKEGIAPLEYFNLKDPFGQLYLLNVEGGSYNPFIRWKSSKSAGSQQTSKILDLIDIDLFGSFVLTYPWEVSQLVYEKGLHWCEEQNFKCFNLFFKKLHALKLHASGRPFIPDGKKLGCSVSFHSWSSDNPLKAHMHNHLMIPHICVGFKGGAGGRNKEYRLGVESDLKSLYDEIEFLDAKLSAFYNNRTKGYEGQCTLDEHIYDLKKQRDVLFDELNNKLALAMGVSRLPWFSKRKLTCDNCGCTWCLDDTWLNDGHDPYECPDCRVFNTDQYKRTMVPFPIAEIKKLWSDCVNDVFSEYVNFPDAVYDVHIKYAYSREKSKLLHWMNYKTRPAVMDLDLFFGFNPSVISGTHDKVSFDLYKVVNKNICVFLKDTPSSEVVSFMQSLSKAKTKTRVYGFWNYLSHYCVTRLDSKKKLPMIDPIDGSFMFPVGRVNWLPSDVLFVFKKGSEFKFFDIKDPPDPGGFIAL